MKKGYILSLSLIIVLISMSCVSAGLFGGLFGEDDDKNITLIKESTGGWCQFYDDGDSNIAYTVEGVFKDLPSDVDGYNLKIAIYDENGKLIKEEDGFMMKTIAKSSKKSNPSLLGVVSVDEFKNVSVAELKIFDKEGTIIFDKNVTFNMENINIDYLTKDTSNSDDEDDSDPYTVEKNEKQKNADEYFNSPEGKRLMEDYDNSI